MLVPWKESYDKPRHHFASKGPYSQSYGFSVVNMDVRIGPLRKLSAKEFIISNCGAGKDSRKTLGQQGDQTSQS